MWTFSPQKSPAKYSEKNASELAPHTEGRWPLLNSTIKRLQENDDKVAAQENFLEELRRSIDEQRAMRTQNYAYRR